jgi:hypothetical protein
MLHCRRKNTRHKTKVLHKKNTSPQLHLEGSLAGAEQNPSVKGYHRNIACTQRVNIANMSPTHVRELCGLPSGINKTITQPLQRSYIFLCTIII